MTSPTTLQKDRGRTLTPTRAGHPGPTCEQRPMWMGAGDERIQYQHLLGTQRTIRHNQARESHRHLTQTFPRQSDSKETGS